ncbi:hypothetical protein EUZ85_05330 [Hahella sp. KA22]|nr:hypothetical protein ENC22_02780 [Hahella sp. KA22]QAY53533.1 hypothetical protein EUZ85_05330 [Hahella sp. KA22]
MQALSLQTNRRKLFVCRINNLSKGMPRAPQVIPAMAQENPKYAMKPASNHVEADNACSAIRTAPAASVRATTPAR